MIYIDRNTVSTPEILNSERASEEKSKTTFFFTKKIKRRQRRHVFKNDIYGNNEVVRTLKKLFHNKCAYCETSLQTSNFDVEHHRPMQGAMELDGSVSKQHYWWLAYDWTNLYLICRVCNSNKRTRFPVDGRRAPHFLAMEEERPLLLDPCKKVDFYEEPFSVDQSGFFIGLTKRGVITIDILGLNRKHLLNARKESIRKLTMLINEVKKNVVEEDEIYNTYKSEILRRFEPDRPYLYALKQFFEVSSRNTRGAVNKAIFKLLMLEIKESVLDQAPVLEVSVDNNVQRPKAAAKKSKGPRLKYEGSTPTLKYELNNLDSKAQKEAYFSTVKRISKIEIKNFKIIKELELDFPKATTSQEPWLVLLGENGTGKSTVLQAIALTLAGVEKVNRLNLDASKFVNRNSRARTGYIKIHFEGIDDHIDLTFSKDSNTFFSNQNDPKVVLLAFGSTRLMTDTQESTHNENATNLRNLLDPFAALPNIEAWIGDPKKVAVDQFDQIAFELKNLLQLPEDKLIYRRRNKKTELYELYIRINANKKGIRLKELSAGYQAVIVLTLNIVRELLKVWDQISIAEGIVLIDEIGVHLHPKWKMQIITTLRNIFPALNFIITTHEPLCLRGVNEGEVVLMKFNEDQEVIALNNLPSPKSLTVEQLITSKFFGLITSFDPKVEKQLNSYYSLNAKLNLTPVEQTMKEVLKKELEDINIIDVNENIDTAASVLDAQWVSHPKQQENLKNRLKEIWKRTSSINKS